MSQEFSVTGLDDLCKSVPAVILTEHPDSAGPNLRKKAMTADNLPSNCLYVSGCCDAHQAHRIVELKERDSIGNVHAIAISAANPELQNKLQLALRSLLAEVVFLHGSRKQGTGPTVLV